MIRRWLRRWLGVEELKAQADGISGAVGALVLRLGELEDRSATRTNAVLSAIANLENAICGDYNQLRHALDPIGGGVQMLSLQMQTLTRLVGEHRAETEGQRKALSEVHRMLKLFCDGGGLRVLRRAERKKA